jgi:hypothetical protein
VKTSRHILVTLFMTSVGDARTDILLLQYTSLYDTPRPRKDASARYTLFVILVFLNFTHSTARDCNLDTCGVKKWGDGGRDGNRPTYRVQHQFRTYSPVVYKELAQTLYRVSEKSGTNGNFNYFYFYLQVKVKG